MKPERKYFKAVVGIALMIISLSISAQEETLGDAKQLFNEAAEAIQAENKELAVEKLTKVIEITAVLYEEEEDEEAETIMYDAMEKVPKLNYAIAKEKLTAKDYAGGLEAAYKAKASAEEYGDDETAEKSSKEIAKVHAKMGISKLKKSNAEGSIVEFDKSIAANPDFAMAYQLKAAAYKSLEDDANLKQTSKEGIAVAERVNDTKTKGKIIKQAYGYFYNKGVNEKGASNYEPAAASFNTALEFNPKSVDASYALASVYQSQNKFDDAITAAEVALANESSDEGKAKVYLLQGQIYKAQDKKTEACEAFSKAAVGAYAETANWEIEHGLKCNE